MPRRKQTDPDEELKKKYGGTGQAQSRLTVHDKFIDVMSGKEKTVADWKKEIAPMKARGEAGKKAIREKISNRQRGYR